MAQKGELGNAVEVFNKLKNKDEQVPATALIQYLRDSGVDENLVKDALTKADVKQDSFLSWIQFGRKIKIINQQVLSVSGVDLTTYNPSLPQQTNKFVQINQPQDPAFTLYYYSFGEGMGNVIQTRKGSTPEEAFELAKDAAEFNELFKEGKVYLCTTYASTQKEYDSMLHRAG